jgi:uncharacterized protein
VVRNPARLSVAGVEVRKGDVLDPNRVAATASGTEAVVSAYAPPTDDTGKQVDGARSLLGGLSAAGVRRLIVVGGAGSLEVAPGRQLLDTPDFPKPWRPSALSQRDALAVLRASDTDWTCLSPAAIIEPGKRTGRFRLGNNALIVNDQGESKISIEDYAKALVDELETPQHLRQRFTLGY